MHILIGAVQRRTHRMEIPAQVQGQACWWGWEWRWIWLAREEVTFVAWKRITESWGPDQAQTGRGSGCGCGIKVQTRMGGSPDSLQRCRDLGLHPRRILRKLKAEQEAQWESILGLCLHGSLKLYFILQKKKSFCTTYRNQEPKM